MKFHDDAYGNDNPEGLKRWRDGCAKAANSSVYKETRAQAKEQIFVVERIHREDGRNDASATWTKCTLEEALEVVRLDAIVHPNYDHFIWRQVKADKDDTGDEEDIP